MDIYHYMFRTFCGRFARDMLWARFDALYETPEKPSQKFGYEIRLSFSDLVQARAKSKTKPYLIPPPRGPTELKSYLNPAGSCSSASFWLSWSPSARPPSSHWPSRSPHPRPNAVEGWAVTHLRITQAYRGCEVHTVTLLGYEYTNAGWVTGSEANRSSRLTHAQWFV